MLSSKPINHLTLLSLFLLLQTAIGGSPFLFHFCGQENYTANSPFGANFKELLTDLSVTTPPSGFGVGSIGQYENQANGLALCRGDVSSTDCKSCVIEAGQELQKRCPDKKSAIVWYDFCLLKYSNQKFFGKIDNSNKFYMWNVQEVDEPEPFNTKVKELLTSLSGKAQETPKLYATGELQLKDSQKLYGLVQCTRDLSSFDCKKCLDGAISELPNCCDSKIGGRVVGGSCNFRYEIYPIVDSQA